MQTICRLMTGAVGRWAIAVILVSWLFGNCANSVVNEPIARPEVVFFPSLASVSSGNQYLLTIQGRIFEPTAKSPGREALIDVLAPSIQANPRDPLFRKRAGYLLSDSIGNTVVTVKIGDRTVSLPASDRAGYFTGNMTLPVDEVMKLSSGGRVPFESVPTRTNPGGFPGNIELVPEEGVTVITDVDDTIKVTGMLNRSEKVANTFLRPFRAVPGMPDLYGAWKTALGPRINFHVVSAGPWQFHEPLRQFAQEARFPAFTWDMRSVDIGDVRVLWKEAFPDPNGTYKFKLQKIRAFMARFPKRHVVLVGDSGEKDPEVYAKVLAEFPDRVDAVFIRNVSREDQKVRYAKLFQSKAEMAKLKVFRNPTELPPLTPPRP
jgi:phosphatidate phosphatase APP1